MGKLKTTKGLKIVIISIVCLTVIIGGYFIYNKKNVETSRQNSQNGVIHEVTRRDILVKISGTGTVQPVSMYSITPLVKGTVLKAPFDEAMDVKKGELLYKIDDSDLLNSIEKTKNSIAKLNLNNQSTIDSINNLIVYAPFDGRIENFYINEGEEIKNNSIKIANIINDKGLKAIIPFSQSQINKIELGQEAKIMVSDYMTYVNGKVVYINNTPKSTENGTSMYNVEIAFENPGIVKEGMIVTATINYTNGSIESSSEGEVKYLENNSIYPETTGTIKQVFVKNNDWVKAGDKILELENSSLINANKKSSLDLRDLQLTLDSQRKQLEDYNILSPIDGIVVEKNFKEGDTINSNTKLMSVANMDQMTFTVDVDELDIAKIAMGQQANITADALPDKRFIGEVTNIAVMGKSQNGVTTYPVEVTISEPGNLKPGMNVNAEILVENKQNVLSVPMAAVTKIRDKAFVFIEKAGKEEPETNGSKLPGERKEVVVGINNDNYIEIISGIEEGEKIYIPITSTGNSNNNNNVLGMRPPAGVGFQGNGSKSRR